MTFRLSLLVLGTALLQSSCRNEVKKAAPVPKPKEEEVTEKKNPRFRVPLGAVISDMKLPYYDEENRQVSLLIAKEMTAEGGNPDSLEIEDPKEVRRLNGTGIKLWLFDKDEKLSSTTTIDTAKYDIEKEQLTAIGKLIMRGVDNKFAAVSEGGVFTLKTGQAFLTGPTFTRFRLPEPKPKDKTTMNFHPILPLAASVQMFAAAPPEVDPQHFAKFERLTAPRVIPHLKVDEHSAKANQLNNQLTDRLTTYLTQIGKPTVLTQVQTQQVAAERDPFEEVKKLGPSDMSIECDQGIYIDSAALEIAYFGVIKAQGKGMILTCNQDLKVIFNPPEPKKDSDKKKEKEKKDDDNPLKDFGGFGDLKQITASGKVFISGESKGEKFFVRGDRALFESDPKNPKTEGTVTLRGDSLSLLLGDPYDLTSKTPLIRQDAKSKNAWIIIKIKEDPETKKIDATFQTNRGHWDTSNPPRKKDE